MKKFEQISARCLATFFIILTCTTEVNAAPTTPPLTNTDTAESNFIENLANIGITYSLTSKDLQINIDEQKTLASIPQLKKLNIMTQDFSPTDIKTKPITLAVNELGLFFTSTIIQQLYQHDQNINLIHATVNLLSADIYGTIIPRACYSFDFNRALYQTTNWDEAQGNMIKTNAPNFGYSDWCTTQMIEERNV